MTDARGCHADAAVGGTVGEVHVVTVAVRTLDEHDVVHVAPALPVEFGLEHRLGEAALQPAGGPVQQRQVDRVRAVGTPFVEEQQEPRLGRARGAPLHRRRARPALVVISVCTSRSAM